MRKVLLASTAIVALGSVSAMASDVTLSGSSAFYYKDYSQNSAWGDGGAQHGSSFSQEADVDFKFTNTTDSGLTLTLAVGLNEGGTMDDQKLSIAGDFGTVRFSNIQEGVGDSAINGGAMVNDETTNLSAGLGKYPGSATGNMISYYTPSMNGLSAAISFADSGTANKSDVTETRVAYSTAVDGTTIDIDYVTTATDDNGTSGATRTGKDSSSIGLKIGMGAITFAGNMAELSENDDTNDYSATTLGVSYKLGNGMTIGVYTNQEEDDKNAQYDYSSTAASIDYVIAPGLTTGITMTDSEQTSSAGVKSTDDYTVIHLTASF